MPKVSIIIPVHNAEAYLRQCLDSVANQSVRDIEAVCVDDGSTDGSAAILAEYAAKDPRVRVVRQDNLGTVVARKSAIAAANGEWCLFLDPDDWLETNACEALLAFQSGTDADILQYGFVLHEEVPRPQAQQKASDAYFNRPKGRVAGSDMFTAVFVERTQSWNLIGRMVRTSVCKPAFAEQAAAYSINQTDVYAVFHLLAHANAIAVSDLRLYHYRYGVGISTKRDLELGEFARMLGKFDTLDELRKFAARYPAGSPQRAAADSIARMMFDATFHSVAAGRIARTEERAAAFRMLREKLPAAELARFLAELYGAAPVSLAQHLDALDALPRPPSPARIRRVGIYYFHLTIGGVQRVVETEVLGLRARGVEVVLFLDDDGSPVEVPIPEDVAVVRLPRLLGGADAADARDRLDALVEALKRHPVDVMHSHQAFEPRTVFDIVACRLVCRIPFFLHVHSTCTASLWTKPSVSGYISAPHMLRLCDGVFALGRMDRTVMAAEGANAWELANPLTPCARKALGSPIARKEPGLVLWVGRLCGEKHPGEAVRVFARAWRKDKAFRMAMVAGGSENACRGLEEIAEREGVADVVSVVGNVADPSPYYEKASVMLVTSDFEGFGLAVQEALAHGVPVVSYAQEGLTLYRRNRAVVQVPPRDVSAAAAALCDLARSPELDRLRELARRSVPRVTAEDFAKRLLEAFSGRRPWKPWRRAGAEAEDLADYLVLLRRALADLHARRSAQMDALARQRDEARAKSGNSGENRECPNSL